MSCFEVMEIRIFFVSVEIFLHVHNTGEYELRIYDKYFFIYE